MIHKNVVLLSIAFLLIFFGYNGVSRYATTFFHEEGFTQVGFNSLILVYLFFLLANPHAVLFTRKYGPKAVMVGSAFSYILNIGAFALGQIWLVYLSSAMLGIGAALLWTGRDSYLLRVSKKEGYGESMGFFESMFFLGSAAGGITFGFLISSFSFQAAFLFALVAPALGILVLLNLQRIQVEDSEVERKGQFRLIRKMAKSMPVLRIAGVRMAISMIFGMAIGVLPIQIQKEMGIVYVGILTSFFFVSPILFGWIIGRVSDFKGRDPFILVSYALMVPGLLFLAFNTGAGIIAGVILLGLAWAISRPVLEALKGDISTKNNLEAITAIIRMAENIGVMAALFLGGFLVERIVSFYVVALLVAGSSFLFFAPLFWQKKEEVRAQIELETKL